MKIVIYRRDKKTCICLENGHKPHCQFLNGLIMDIPKFYVPHKKTTNDTAGQEADWGTYDCFHAQGYK